MGLAIGIFNIVLPNYEQYQTVVAASDLASI